VIIMEKGATRWAILFALWGLALCPCCSFQNSEREAQRLYEEGLNALDEKEVEEALAFLQQAVREDPRHAKAHCRLGSLYLDLDQAVLAEREFMAALAEDPSLKEARKSLARLFYERGAYEKAIPHFRKLIENDGEDPNLPLYLSGCLLRSGDVSAGRQIIEKTAADHPRDISIQLALARFYEKAGMDPLAEKTFYNILNDFPTSSRAHAALMAFYMNRDLLGKAESIGEAAVRAGFAREDVYHRLFLLESRRNHPHGALRHLEAAVEISPGDRDLWMLLGDYRLFLKMYPQAREVYESMVASWPDAQDAHNRIAEIFIAEGRYAEALGYLEKILSKWPDNVRARLLRGLLYIRKGSTDEARIDILQALLLAPESAEARYFYGLTFLKDQKYDLALPEMLRAVEQDPDSLRARLALAYVYYKTDQFVMAADHLDRIMAMQSDNLQARALRATVRIRLKKYDAAASDYEYLIQTGKADPKMRFHLAEIYKAQGKLHRALRLMEEALTQDPDSPRALKEKATILAVQGAYDRAVQVCEAYLESRPDDLNFGMLKAGILLKQGRHTQAQEVLARLLQKYPASRRLAMLTAKALMQQKRYEEALAYLQKANADNPQAVTPYMEMAQIYRLKGEPDKAIKAYEAVLTRDDAYWPALNDLAYLYAEQNRRLDRALSLALKAFQLMPDNPAVRDTLGWSYHKKGSVLLAKMHLIEAVQRDRKNPLFRYHLGVVLHASHDRSQAEIELDRAIRLGLEGKELASARRILKQIQTEGAS